MYIQNLSYLQCMYLRWSSWFAQTLTMKVKFVFTTWLDRESWNLSHRNRQMYNSIISLIASAYKLHHTHCRGSQCVRYEPVFGCTPDTVALIPNPILSHTNPFCPIQKKKVWAEKLLSEYAMHPRIGWHLFSF